MQRNLITTELTSVVAQPTNLTKLQDDYNLIVYRTFHYPKLGTIVLRRNLSIPVQPQMYISYQLSDEVQELRFAKIVYDVERNIYLCYHKVIEMDRRYFLQKQYDPETEITSLRRLYPKYTFCTYNSELFKQD